MKKFRLLSLAALMMVSISAFAAQDVEQAAQENDSKATEASRIYNFELIVQNETGDGINSWKADIFSMTNGSQAGSISSETPGAHLQSGNYLFMLHFEGKIPEIPEKKPFTFSIADKTKTLFTLAVGNSREPEVEPGFIRTGADFIDSDPRHGRDYVNFTLGKNQAAECLARCKKDRNCDAYSYGEHPDSSSSRCWLIHGAAVPIKADYAVSGRIHRDDAPPYQIQITNTPLTD